MAWATKLGAPRVQTKDALVERAAAIQVGQYGLPYMSQWDVQRALSDGYDRVMWVFRCVDAIASNAAQLPVVLRKGDADRGEVVTDHPALQMMNGRANGFETADVFWYRLFSQYLLSKKGVFVEIRYNKGGDPVEMYLLPPHWTNPIPDPDTFVSGYRVMIPGAQAWTDVPAVDPATGMTKVVWIRKPHPLDPYSGVTPLESMGLSIDIDFYARLYNRAFLQNDGRPGGVLAVKGELNDRDAEELRRRFSQGPNKAGATAVVEADDLEWIDVSTTPRDAQYIEGRGITKEEIMIGFGVPESILGNASGRTYDNADAEKLVFWQESMQFHLRLVAGFYDFLTDDDYKTAFDTTSIAVLRRDREQEEDHDKGLVITGLMTIDEFRDKHGRDEFATPAARALWVPNNLVAQPAEGDEDAFAPVAPAEPGHTAAAPPATPVKPGTPGETPAAELPAGDPAAPALPAGAPQPAGASKSVVRPKSGAGSLSPAMRASIVKEAEAQRADFEKKAKETASALFKRQQKVVTAKLTGTKARKGTRHWNNPDGRPPVVTKSLNVDDVFDQDRWDQEWTDDFTDLGTDIYGQVGSQVADDFDSPDDYDPSGEQAAAAIALMAKNHAQVAAKANETTKQALAQMIQDNEDDDADISSLEDNVNDYFDQSANVDDGRSSDIGTWFAVGAIAGGAMLAATSLFGDDGTSGDGSVTKGWVSMQDGTVRPSHQDADDTYGNSDGSIPLDEAFNVGGEDLMYPGDPDGDPGETVNCRCTMVFYRNGDEVDSPDDDDSGDDEKSLQAKFNDNHDENGRFSSSDGSGGGSGSLAPITSVNPTGSVFVSYSPEQRAKAPLGSNMTSLAKAAGKSPTDTVKVYRGATSNQTKIVPGDFITTNKQLAQDYAGSGHVIEQTAQYGDILADKDDWEGEEYLYRPGVDAEVSGKSLQAKFNDNHDENGRFSSGDGSGGGSSALSSHEGAVKATEQWRSKLSGPQAKALDVYKISGYKDANAKLRAGADIKDVTMRSGNRTADARAMQKAINAYSTPEAMTLYRGIQANVPVPKVGDVITDKGFSSTTSDPKTVPMFQKQGGTVMQIEAPAGTHAAYNEADGFNRESEWVLPAGSSFKITSSEPAPDGNGHIVKATLVGNE